MARKAIPRKLRKNVRDRAHFHCEYCQTPDAFACAPFACEHVLPHSKGAGDTLEELAWSCPGCNGHKSDKTQATDPASGRLVRLFNPREQNWSRHFRWSEDLLMIEGRTASGGQRSKHCC